MKLINFEAGPIYTNCYIVYDENEKQAVLIDSPPDCTENAVLLAKEKGMEIKAVFLTHSHWDHTMDAAGLQREHGAEIYCHPDDEYRLLDPMEHVVYPIPFEIEALRPDKHFEDGAKIEIGGMEFEIMHSPGHTEGGVVIICHNEKLAFTGDSIFEEGIGRCDLPGGDFPTLMNSIKTKILALPDDYKLYPGHGGPTTVKNEKLHNTFIR